MICGRLFFMFCMINDCIDICPVHSALELSSKVNASSMDLWAISLRPLKFDKNQRQKVTVHWQVKFSNWQLCIPKRIHVCMACLPYMSLIFFGTKCKFKKYIPGTCLSSILGVEPSKTRSFPIKTMVIWILGRYI